MKHSAKAAAKLARQRERQQRRTHAATAVTSEALGPDEQQTAAAESSAARPAATQSSARTAATESSGARTAARRAGLVGARVSRAATRSAAGQADAQPFVAQLPYALVLVGLVLGLALMLSGGQAVKDGTLVIAGALLAGSASRLILPDGKVGLLRSRRRLFDVALLTALGVGLLIAGVIVQVPG